MAQRVGWEFQVTCMPSSQVYNLVCNGYDTTRESKGTDLSNSEGRPGNPAATNQSARGFQARGKNQRSCTVRLMAATLDDTENPFIGTGNEPLNWKEGDYVNNLKIHPAGVGVGNAASVETYQSLIISKIHRSGKVGENQPFDVEFESDGQYS